MHAEPGDDQTGPRADLTDDRLDQSVCITIEKFRQQVDADMLVVACCHGSADHTEPEYTDAEQQYIMQKYATERKVLEAPKLIAAKAKDMLLHYAARILPDGFKAQVVATSREAAVIYQEKPKNRKAQMQAVVAMKSW